MALALVWLALSLASDSKILMDTIEYCPSEGSCLRGSDATNFMLAEMATKEAMSLEAGPPQGGVEPASVAVSKTQLGAGISTTFFEGTARDTKSGQTIKVAVGFMSPASHSGRFDESELRWLQVGTPKLMVDVSSKYLRSELKCSRYISNYLVDPAKVMGEGKTEKLRVVMNRRGSTLSPEDVGTSDVAKAVGIAFQMATSIMCLHQANYVHRDIKPPNFLWGHPDDSDAHQIYITDFGLTCTVYDKGCLNGGDDYSCNIGDESCWSSNPSRYRYWPPREVQRKDSDDDLFEYYETRGSRDKGPVYGFADSKTRFE